MAACAVVVGMVSPILRGQMRVGGGELFASALIGCGVMIILGLFVGLFHSSRANGIGWGVVVGSLLGMVCGPLMFVPPNEFPFVFVTAIGGSVMILLVAVFIRLSTSARAPLNPSLASPKEAAPVEAAVVKPKRHPLAPDEDDDIGIEIENEER